ncbi:hypothetical protein predicted by Glimmer/Critica [Sorangium cellulosum So ce56]|uniref:Repeat-companion domain protein n=1 Tax=Sorangium cellulosum (strain So ce56) TaxID=448385 RepID=A9GAA8_SORC5|nr:tetratricopeptide repeat protein [Sorangium cellulosum]CAN92839.1 hypothetical protein predicted by Glimmer/Critica [Sorangium cellulosum So ce56]
MNDRELEAALRRDPTDPQAWLAYAETLRAAGDPLAELIEWERRVRADEAEAWQARRRAREELRGEWELSDKDGVDGEFEWGLFKVRRVRKHHAACLWRLTRVRLLDASSLELEQLPRAELEECLAALESLKPRRLLLSDALLDAGDALTLARAPAATMLRQLVLEASGASFEGDAVMAEFARVLPKEELEQLGLWNLRIGDAGLEALHGAGAWLQLRHLSLGFNERVLSGSLCTLFEGACWPRLERLALGCSEVDASMMPRLSGLPLSARLRSLSLWGTPAGPAFWRDLAESASWASLLRLNVEESDFDDAAAYALSHARDRSLELLMSFFTPLGADAALSLLRAEGLPSLRLLANITSATPEQMAELRGFNQRFTLGSVHDCGTPQWIVRDHFQMDPW